ncbi:MAG TPA: ABC transporter ATP-binding protein [Rhizomicrobium sp.]|nr:ABC transporter ATP-binding protein [Rhizomicrobium sp.]
MSALSFRKVSVAYGARPVLQQASAEFAKGAVTAIVGPNGAGKTTLFRAALGLLPVRGEIRILGNERKYWSREGLSRSIAYLPQGADAHWPISAKRLVALGRLPHRKLFAPQTEIDDAAILNALDRCEATEFIDRPIDQLSAGERSRVLLARALATGAPILMADEPAAHLDPAHQIGLMRLLRQEAARGTAVLVTLHDLALASRYCDAVVVIEKGRIAAQGSPEQALDDATLARVFGIKALRVREAEGSAVLAWTAL